MLVITPACCESQLVLTSSINVGFDSECKAALSHHSTGRTDAVIFFRKLRLILMKIYFLLIFI